MKARRHWRAKSAASIVHSGEHGTGVVRRAASSPASRDRAAITAGYGRDCDGRDRAVRGLAQGRGHRGAEQPAEVGERGLARNHGAERFSSLEHHLGQATLGPVEDQFDAWYGGQAGAAPRPGGRSFHRDLGGIPVH